MYEYLSVSVHKVYFISKMTTLIINSFLFRYASSTYTSMLLHIFRLSLLRDFANFVENETGSFSLEVFKKHTSAKKKLFIGSYLFTCKTHKNFCFVCFFLKPLEMSPFFPSPYSFGKGMIMTVRMPACQETPIRTFNILSFQEQLYYMTHSSSS